MEVERIVKLDGHTFFKHGEHTFSRIIGGIGWPGVKPGFIVTIAENYQASDVLGKVRHLRILAEAEEQDPIRVFHKAIDFRERYQIERFLANTESESMLDLLAQFNRALDGAKRLNLYDASFPSDFRYHVSLIKSCVGPESKTLHFGEPSLVRDYLLEVNLDDLSKSRPEDYPAIFAVGFVLSYIRNYPKDPIRDRIRKTPKEEEYNPLTFGLKPEGF